MSCYLAGAVWPSAKSLKSGRILLLTMLCAHLLLAAGFMLYFYHAQPLAPLTPIPPVQPTQPASLAPVQPSAIPKAVPSSAH